MEKDKEAGLREVLKRAVYKESEVQKLKTLVSIQDSTIATEGAIVTIGGLPKARKSTFMVGLLSAIFSGENVFGFEAEKGKVIICDTEQTPYDFTRQMDLLKKLSKKKTIPKDLISFLFRQDSIETIKESLILAIEKIKPTYLIIDSITDLCYNVNDFEESKKLVQFLKQVSAIYNVCIITIVHLSKTNNFTLGALGSALDRVSQSTLLVKKDRDTGQSFIEPLYLRSADDFSPVYISYNKEEQTYEQTMGEAQESKKFSMGNFRAEELSTMTDIIFTDQKEFTYKALVDRCRAIFGKGDTITRSVIIPYMIHKKYFRTQNGNYIR
jgi:archaellum biogenesis ATPase FlaH